MQLELLVKFGLILISISWDKDINMLQGLWGLFRVGRVLQDTHVFISRNPRNFLAANFSSLKLYVGRVEEEGWREEDKEGCVSAVVWSFIFNVYSTF